MNPDSIAADGELQPLKPTIAGMTTKVVKGTLWTMIGLTVPILFSLFATPLNTRLLGAEGYGLFVLVLLIPAYFSFADFGMNIASTKFASAAYAEGDPKKEARVVRTAGFIALISSLPFAAAIAIFSLQIVELFNVPPHLVSEAALALKIAGVTFVFNFLASIFNSPEVTRLRMDLNISVTSGIRLAGIILTPIVIYLGGGVLGAVSVALAVSILTLAGHMIVSTKLLPELMGSSIDRSLVRPMLKFGGSLVVAGIAAVLLTNLERFVLTRATSVETLAYYSIAATFAAMLTLFSASIVQSLMPAFSQLQSEENRTALNALYSRGIRLTLVWLVPAAVFMVLVGRPFFTYWFGPDFGRESTVPFYIIIAGFLFNVLAYFPYSAIMASGRSDVFAKIYWAELVPFIFLTWLLATRYGAVGAALAWSSRVVFDALWLFWFAHKVGGVSYRHVNPGVFAGAVGIMLIPLAALVWFQELSFQVILITAVCAVTYALIAWKKALDDDEIAWAKAKAAAMISSVRAS